MRKKYIILLVLCVLMLVGCSGGEEQQELKTTTEKQSSNQETSLEETTSESSVTEKIATDESTTEEPTTEKTTYDTSTYIPNGKTPQLMIDVLLNDVEFVFVQMDYPSTEKIATWSKTLSTFNYENNDFQNEPVKFGFYRVVDLDGDGYNEAIIDIPSTETLILHYEEDQVYGFMYPWLGVKRIFTSGVTEGAEGGSHIMYSIIDFNKDTYTDTTIAEFDYILKEQCNVYYVEGKKTSLEEYKEYKNDDRFKDIVPYWSDYELLLNTK